jgi:hypothetical protein
LRNDPGIEKKNQKNFDLGIEKKIKKILMAAPSKKTCSCRRNSAEILKLENARHSE